MSRSGFGFYPSPRKRPPPEHGLRVRTIGGTWWAERWIAALERLSPEYPNRLARGRSYARAGRVHDLEVAAGRVRARVTGSRATPYRVALGLEELSAEAWSRAIEHMAAKAIFAAELLAGAMPSEIDEAFAGAGASLFPHGKGDLRTACSCPDEVNPCKHVAATHYVLGEALERDPFLLFELRGRTRQEVLAALRRSRARAAAESAGSAGAGPQASAGPALPLDLEAAESFEHPRAALGDVRFRIEAPAVHAAVLRQLGQPASWSVRESLAELLGPAYEAAGDLARRLALAPTDADAGTGPPLRAEPDGRRNSGGGGGVVRA